MPQEFQCKEAGCTKRVLYTPQSVNGVFLGASTSGDNLDLNLENMKPRMTVYLTCDCG